jgi:uncharacterized repeat protein (TIGR04052 family)
MCGPLMRGLRSLALSYLLVASAAHAQTGSVCVGDANGDGEVTIEEIITSVNNSLEGCGFIPITLQFKAMVGDQPFKCGQVYEGIGTSGDRIIPADLRFYISNIRLVTNMDKEVPLALVQDHVWQDEDVVLLDFEDKTPPCNQGTTQTNGTVHGRAPAGSYTGVRFTLGVPFSLNHQNQAIASSPLNLTSMFWSWQSGYKFLRFDEATDAVRMHLGSTGCVYSSPPHVATCARPNRGEISLTGFDPSADTIVFDLAALFTDFNLASNVPDTPPGCMSDTDDADCSILMRNLGINFDNGMPDPSRQTVFHIEKPVG